MHDTLSSTAGMPYHTYVQERPETTILTKNARPAAQGLTRISHTCMRMGRTGSPLAAARHKAAQVHKAPVSNVLAVDVYALALPAQEVRCVDCACAAAVHRIERVPACTTAEETSINEQPAFGPGRAPHTRSFSLPHLDALLTSSSLPHQASLAEQAKLQVLASRDPFLPPLASRTRFAKTLLPPPSRTQELLRAGRTACPGRAWPAARRR